MIKNSPNDKSNQIVLGILIRTTRIEKGYSLRQLAEIVKISHTLISNIETGKQVPSGITLSDIFKALDLKLYESKLIHEEMKYFYNEIFKTLFSYEYEEAYEFVKRMESKAHVYEYSYEVVNYNIIRCLYYTLTNTNHLDTDKVLNKYETIVGFLNDYQQQMFYFCSGLDALNKEMYKDATLNFNIALTMGNRHVDVLIKEYNARSLIRQYKFTDTMSMCKEAIEEFEERTEYIRAMRVRLSIVRVYLHIMKLSEVEKLTEYVERFAVKMKIQSLVDQCHVIKATSNFYKKDYKKAEFSLRKHENQETTWLILPWFRIYTMLRDGRVHDYYKNVVLKRQSELTRKKFLLIKVLYLWHFPEFRKDDDYLASVVELIEEGKKSMDQEVITLSHNLHIIYYKEKRSYKKALDIVEEFLQLKKIYI